MSKYKPENEKNELRLQIEKGVEEGKSFKKISEQLGLSATSIQNWAKKFGIEPKRRFKERVLETPPKGTKIGRWTFLGEEQIIQRKSGYYRYWKCQCECGYIKLLLCSNLVASSKTGKPKGCGCVKYKDGFTRKWLGCGEIGAHYIGMLKKSAERRNIEFEVSTEYLWKIFLDQDRKCALSGISLTFSRTKKRVTKQDRKEQTASVDRIDPNLGYIEGNVQWVHKDINKIKYDFTEEELFYYIKYIYEHQKGKGNIK